MSLRSKILGLYLGFALAPMVALALFSYAQSTSALRALVDSKLQSTSEQIAGDVSKRIASAQASLSFVPAPATSAPGVQLAEPWQTLQHTFELIEFVGEDGTVLRQVDLAGPAPAVDCVSPGAPLVPIRMTTGSTVSGAAQVVGWARAGALLDVRSLAVRFGQTGRTFVYDRVTGQMLYGGCDDAAVPTMAGGEPLDFSGASASPRIRIGSEGEELDAAFTAVPDLPWTVVVATQPTEFTAAYARDQMMYMILVLFLAVAAGGAFLILAQHFMGSLEELTVAAERIGEGDLAPWLPLPGSDEVGRLSHALSHMLERLQATMRQSQSAWQAAAVGGVASQLSHEIRNPLSSIRLNLQSVDREVRAGKVPEDLSEVIGVCMREIERLNDAVSAVLEFGQPSPPNRQRCSLTAVVDESLALVRPRLKRNHIEILWEPGEVSDEILGDAAQLRGVFLNLFLNAADAMQGGGILRVVMESAETEGEVRVRVSDTGPGVRPDMRSQIFEPFFTTRADGTGIGLPVARQTIEAHGGRLGLDKRSELERGAEFVVVLPLHENRPAPVVEPARSSVHPLRSRVRTRRSIARMSETDAGKIA